MTATKQRLLWGLGLAVLTLAGLNLWLEPIEDSNAEAWAQAWPTLRASEVDEVRLTGGAVDLVLARSIGGWEIRSPESRVADTRHVEQLLESVAGLTVGPALKIEGLEPFGLESPVRRVHLSGGGELLGEVAVGRKAPAGSGTYVHLDGQVHMSRFPLEAGMASGVDHYTTREVLRFARSAVDSIRITGGSEPIALDKSSSGWTLGGESAAPERVEAFLTALENLRVEAHGASAGVPEDEYRVTLEGGELRTELQIWRQSGRWWATGPLHRGPVEITPGLAPMLGVPAQRWTQPIGN
jgi:hypothetical protein